MRKEGFRQRENLSTAQEDRLWPVGTYWWIDDGAGADLVKILGYYAEDDINAPTEVVLQYVEMESSGVVFPEIVDRIKWWMFPVHIEKPKQKEDYVELSREY
jgi:hypothetical protein